MDNLTEEIVRENGEESTVLDSANVTPTGQFETVEEITNSTDASQFSSDSQALSVDEEPKLPILKKFEDLSNNIQTLRKEHTTLSNEVKDAMNQFPGFEVLNTLQQLSEENELLKKKYKEESELLKKKYVEEYGERKRLYNEVIELKGNIRVFCRCRPLNQEEIANGSTSVVEIPPSQDHELTIVGADSSKKFFKFDHVFGPQSNQEEVFAQTSPIVTSVLDGYNVCIFAYGQTGTGKTFTMEGTPESRGVNYRTLEKLFSSINQRSGTMKYELFVSMLEVYNEKIRDLLVEHTNEPPKKLEIKQTPEGTHEIPGLVEACVHGTDEVWELLKTGSQVRSVGSTNANECSSRSHCLLRVTVKGENLLNGQRTKSNLWLVDLAGSERVGRIEVEGERLKESQFINKSLSALGDVISALASKTAHVPYRNSKLTHMLQSSLGGDCKTLMFVQISPSDADLGETLCSLNFASRVKGIEHGPARKQTDHSELLRYKHLAEKLKHDEKETKKLQDNVQSLQLRLSCREYHCRSLQEKVRELENQLAEERRKTRQKQESQAVASDASARQPRQGPKNTTEKKPPLGPSNTRMPLRNQSNFIPQRSLVQTKKTSNFSSFFPSSNNGKENMSNGSNIKAPIRGPRRFSVAVRQSTSSEAMAPSFQPRRRVSVGVRPSSSPSYETAVSSLQPRRRVSVAVRPTSSSEMVAAPSLLPRRRVSIATTHPDPNMHPGTPKQQESGMLGRALFREPSKDSRIRRYSKLFSESRPGASSSVEATPMSSKRFMGSPPTEHTPWRPKHPIVVALQKKPVVWSPLQSRGFKNTRKSVV